MRGARKEVGTWLDGLLAHFAGFGPLPQYTFLLPLRQLIEAGLICAKLQC